MSNTNHNFVFNVAQYSHGFGFGFIWNYLASRDQLKLKFLIFLVPDEIDGFVEVFFFAFHKDVKICADLFSVILEITSVPAEE